MRERGDGKRRNKRQTERGLLITARETEESDERQGHGLHRGPGPPRTEQDREQPHPLLHKTTHCLNRKFLRLGDQHADRAMQREAAILTPAVLVRSHILTSLSTSAGPVCGHNTILIREPALSQQFPLASHAGHPRPQSPVSPSSGRVEACSQCRQTQAKQGTA